MMNFRKSFALAVVTLSFAGIAAHAQTSTWTIDPAHSSSEFQIRHMGVSNVRGAITGIKGEVVLDEKNITKSHVEATLDTTTLNTSVDARDKHLKSPDFFNVEQFPTLTFKSTSVTSSGGKLQVIGDLTRAGGINIVTRRVYGPTAPVKGQGGKLVTGFSATGTLKRSDFNFGSKFGPTALGDDVQFTIDVEAGK